VGIVDQFTRKRTDYTWEEWKKGKPIDGGRLDDQKRRVRDRAPKLLSYWNLKLAAATLWWSGRAGPQLQPPVALGLAGFRLETGRKES
jgi:hypothetical protein